GGAVPGQGPGIVAWALGLEGEGGGAGQARRPVGDVGDGEGAERSRVGDETRALGDAGADQGSTRAAVPGECDVVVASHGREDPGRGRRQRRTRLDRRGFSRKAAVHAGRGGATGAAEVREEEEQVKEVAAPHRGKLASVG